MASTTSPWSGAAGASSSQTALPCSPASLARLRSEHGPTVVAALQALAQIGDTSALPSLTAYATDTRHEVSNAAKATLQTLQERARAQGAAAGLSLGEAGSEGELSLAQPGEAGQLSPPAQDDGKKPDD